MNGSNNAKSISYKWPILENLDNLPRVVKLPFWQDYIDYSHKWVCVEPVTK